MVATINVNPIATTNAASYFSTQTEGLYQGVAFDDPEVRFALAGGVLGPNETLPMWGGVGISETVVAGQNGAQTTLGGIITRATTETAAASGQLTGFSVFNQAHNWIATPSSPVPTALPGMTVPFFRLGTGARIAVAADPALVSLETGVITQQVSWDFVNQRLVPYVGTLTISSGTYVTGTGVVTLTMSAPITFGPGDAIIVSGLTGSGAFASLAGTFTALAGTTGSTVVYNAGSGLGAAAITGGSLTLGSGASSLLPVKVLRFDPSNAKTVSYASATGYATWNNNGSAAVILI